MNRSPNVSTATPAGPESCAEVAGPPSPLKPNCPLPATVLINPFGVTLRTRWLAASEMNRSPNVSTATPAGPESCAEAAGPPSPLKPNCPLPATVLINPFGVTLRTRWLGASRSEEHTSELQSLRHLVCRLLLEKKKTAPTNNAQQ